MADFLTDLGLIRGSLVERGTNKLGLVIGQDSGANQLHPLIAYLSLSGPVRVLDAGNNFNLLDVAYAIRRVTQNLYEAADRIHIVRAFTCIEVLKALQEQDTGTPLVIINMLATFYDEAVTNARIRIMMDGCIAEISRLRQSAPVIVSVRDECPPNSPRNGLLQSLVVAADIVKRIEPETLVHQEHLI